MSLLQMSISGAIIILVIVVVRALAINKLPKKTFLALWGIALLRLLVPLSLPSMFSVYSVFNRIVPDMQAVHHTPGVNLFSTTPDQIITTITNETANGEVRIAISVWTVIWMIGLITCFLFFAISYVKCRREFETSLPVENEFIESWLTSHKSKRLITIRQSSRISAPLTYGVFHPVILMPKNTNWTDINSLQYVLAHEYTHIRRFDAITKLVLIATLCIHWFNPMVWVMYILSNRDIELSCDEAVVRLFGDGNKATYARTLISMEEMKSGLTPLCNSFSKNAIEERVTAIMKMKKTSIVALAAAVLLIGGVTTVFATSAKAETDNVPQAYETNTAITQKEQAELDGQKKAELAEQVSIYKDYGLTYEATTDSFYYDGKLVRRFSDKLNADNEYITFVRNNDGIDLQAVRNDDYQLIGITEVSQAEYDKHTQSIKDASSMGSGTYEQGNPEDDFNKSLLNDYLEFGVSYDDNSGLWLYNNQNIYFLSDGDNATYFNGSLEATHDGVAIQVIRNSNDQIDSLVEITSSQVDALMNNTTQER